MDLNKEENGLFKVLKGLQLKLMRATKENFNRVNPLVEDLTDWKERGDRLTKLVKHYKSKDSRNYDCIVPVTGAGDSFYILHIVKNKLGLNDICGIGYPGITLNHDPKKKTSTYMGDPNRIKSSLNIPLVADFRQCDINSGGEGAPLTGYFHEFLNKRLSKKI